MVKVRVGVVDTGKVIEIDVEDTKIFEAGLVEAFSKGVGMIWFDDSDGRRVGVPADKVAFVEIQQAGDRKAVGFGG